MSNVTAQIWNGTSYVSYVPQRTANGNVYNFVADDTELAIVATAASTGDVYWTGANGRNWDTSTKNWEGNMASSAGPAAGFIAKHFMSGDHVKFDDGVLGTPAANRNIAIQGNVNVGSMEVVGADLGYSFDFTNSTGITSAGAVIFRDSDLEGIKIDTTISAATGITFAGGTNTNFVFNFDGVSGGETMLHLEAGTTVTGHQLGGGTIDLRNLPGSGLGDDGHFILIDITDEQVVVW